jgi:hypothetical protein
MREVPFVRKADDLALATSHLAQSSSASRFTAGAAKFFILSQSDDRPEPSSLPAAALGEHRHCGLLTTKPDGFHLPTVFARSGEAELISHG